MNNKQEYMEELLATIIRNVLEKDNGKVITSIIVTGSVGRGEPTFCTDEKGDFHLKSDVEIALIYKHMREKKQLLDLMPKVESLFTETVELMPFQERRLLLAQNHNYAFVEPKKKTLFTYDVYNGSYTIWGKDYLRLKAVIIDDVDKFEAKRIVANRIGELIHNFNRNEDISKSEYRMIWKGKIILAIVSAWLLLKGEYKSSYLKQYEIIQEKKPEIESIFGEEFVNEYKKTLLFLRESGPPYEISDDNLREYVRIINTEFIKMRLVKSQVNCLSKRIRSFIKYIKTGMHYGFRFENTILQTIIDDFVSESDHIKDSAEVWSKVLYY